MTDEERAENAEPTPEETPPEDQHEFLIPGPTPTSNEGCFAWGASWVIVSLVLLVIVAVMTVGCFLIALVFDLM